MKIGDGGIPAGLRRAAETVAAEAQEKLQQAAEAPAQRGAEAGDRFESLADGAEANVGQLMGGTGRRAAADHREQRGELQARLADLQAERAGALGGLQASSAAGAAEATAEAMKAAEAAAPVLQAAAVVAAVVTVVVAVVVATFTFGAAAGLVALAVVGAGAAIGGVAGAKEGAGDPFSPDLAAALRGGVKGSVDGGKVAAALLSEAVLGPARTATDELRRRLAGVD